jgi:hypothetical protein
MAAFAVWDGACYLVVAGFSLGLFGVMRSLAFRSFAFLICVRLLAIGCGGSSGEGDLDPAGGRKGGSGGSESGGTGGSASGGMGTGGAAGSGGFAGSGGSGAGGTGGSVPSWSCDAPYSGPVAGPRADGPDNPSIGSCDELSETMIKERYANSTMKVPRGYYFEPDGQLLDWNQPCSSSLSATVANSGLAIPNGELEAEFTTDYFYEAAVCDDGKRRLYRNLRCDYFDGLTLGGGPFSNAAELGFLASLLWFIDNHNVSGFHLLAVIVRDDLTVDLCTTETTFGDFGLCDEIQVQKRTYSVSPAGVVTMGATEDLKLVQGRCR